MNKQEKRRYDREYYQKNKLKKLAKCKQYQQKHKEERVAYKKQYYQKYKEEILAHNRQKYQEHKKERSIYAKQYYKEHRKEILTRQKQWQKANLDKVREHYRKKAHKRERNLGFVPLNEWFEGSEAHHIDRERVIYMPKEYHQSVWHCLETGKNMTLINSIAWDYLIESKIAEEA